MKTLLLFCLLFAGLFTTTATAQITVTSPNGGESLPRNGYMIFWWSNAVPLQVTGFLDHYDDSGTEVVQTFNMISKGYFYAGTDYTQNGNGFDTTSMPTGLYKLRVVGNTQDGNFFTDTSDGYFRITRDASMTCMALNGGDWIKGQSKKFHVSWDGFAPGDPYTVYLFFADDYQGEGYGFVLQSGNVQTESGAMIIDAPFPTESMSAWPEYQVSVPIDATYVARFQHDVSLLSAKSDRVSLIIKDVRLTIFEQKEFNSELGKQMNPLTLIVDARYARTDIGAIQVPIAVYAEQQGAEFICALYDGHRQVSQAKTIRITDIKGMGYLTLEARGLNVRRGGSAALELRCIPTRGTGVCLFGFNREGDLKVSGKRGEVISSAMRGYWSPPVTIVPVQPVRQKPCRQDDRPGPHAGRR